MDRLHEEYLGLPGINGTSPVMELRHCGREFDLVDGFLTSHFNTHLDDVLRTDAGVDIFCDIERIAAEDFQCRLLMVHHDGENISRYYEARHVDEPTLSQVVRGLAVGQHLPLHFKGNGAHETLHKLAEQLNSHHVFTITGYHPYGQHYHLSGYICIDGLVQDPQGIHLRNANHVVSVATQYPELPIEVGVEDKFISATDVMGILTLAASFGTKVTVRTAIDTPKGIQALIDVYKATQTVYERAERK